MADLTVSSAVDTLMQATNQAGIKTAVGLGNCDNTSDANKPVSTATQTAIDAVAASVSLPALLADFAEGSYRSSSTLRADFAAWLTATSGTYTRGGSNHRYINSSGYLVNGSADTLRIAYDPVSLKAIGALFEPARTNLITYSDDFSSTKWAFSNSNITKTDNAATGITGTQTAATVIETASNAVHKMWYYDGNISITSGNIYCYSVYVKSIGGRGVNLVPSANTGLPETVVSFTKQQATNGWNLEPQGSGVYRLWKTATAGSTGVPNFQYITHNGSSTTFTGTTGHGFQIEKAQYEQVSALTDGPSSYIDNAADTQNTRSADALVFTVPAGTLYTIYGDGNWAGQSVSAGSHSFVPSTLYGIVRRISTGLPVTTETNNKLLRAKLSAADIYGLTKEDSPRFQSIDVISGDIIVGADSVGIIRISSGVTQMTSGRALMNPATTRAIVFGQNPAQLIDNPSNSVVIGNDAAKVATTLATSTVINDTAGAAATVISGSEVIGNEAGNGLSQISSCVIIGNLAAAISGNAGACVVIGNQASRATLPVSSVVVGDGAAKSPSTAQLNNSVVIGATSGDNITGTRTGLILIGYAIDPPSATTDDYLSIGDVYRGVPSTQSAYVGKPSLATNATSGFAYLPACAGTPTGTPTAVTGMVPMVFDSTNNKLYFYSNGAWRDAGP